MTPAIGRLAVLCALLASLAIALAPGALADAPGPTDYITEIVAIEPANDAVRVTMIGGDSFMRLEQLRPVEVIVLGYQSEPYLRFAPDGQVFENRRAPSTWLNQERYGSEEPPGFADAEALPQWVQVASNGRYSWHDHRSHWMNEAKPPGKQPGDVVLEDTVPMIIDGEPAMVAVTSYLLASPPWWPIIVGAIGGLGLALLMVRSGTRATRLLVAAVTAAWCLVFGLIAYMSVPAETAPSQQLWLLPAVAVGAALLAFAVRNRLATTVYLDGLAVIAGVALVVWTFGARDGALRRALIPSDAPAALDRFGLVVALVVAVTSVAYGAFGLLRPQRLARV